MPDWIIADWPARRRVRTLITTRDGGVSEEQFGRLNLAAHVGDAPEHVAENRARLRAHLPAEPFWLEQVHGTRVLRLEQCGGVRRADAAVTSRSGLVCAVLTADCVPVLLCDGEGSAVGVAHAGWRGLAAGVIEATVLALGIDSARLLAYLGPAIGPESYEVGDEVRRAFVGVDRAAIAAFRPGSRGRWWCDLYALARMRLAACGVREVWGGGFDTAAEPERFFSHRRDGVSGRMASLIWLDRD